MNFDIMIVGGGMVGGALALALSQGPWQIALIEAKDEKAEDARLIALNEGSCCLFKNLNIWPALAPNAAPIEQVHVSHRGHFGITRITAEESGVSTLGHVVPAKYINHAIFSELLHKKNVNILCPAKVTGLSQSTEGVTLTITNQNTEKTYTADMVIGADGNHSTIRELLNIPIQKTDYDQSALVTITQLSRHHKNIAYERFLKNGAIAMLPLTENRAATIWSTSNTEIATLMNLSDAEFLQQLQHYFGYRLGRLLATGHRATYPLFMQKAQQQKKQNVLLIGNAAHTLHPVAAQGLNIALHEVAVLTEYLQSQSSLKKCLQNFSEDLLQQPFNHRLSHELTDVFSKDLLPLRWARPLAMMGFDQCPPLKKKFAAHAMGKAGRVPQLFIKNTE